MNILLLFIFFVFVYSMSLIGSLFYLNEKNYNFKLIYLIATFTPLWNTYLAIKWVSLRNFKPIIESIKYHFTWDKE